ncbi:hypothetical protein PUV54_00570 [Hyphococcus flavus]|uniref:Lipoprotein n=1 Tax=Hyphococcus flavus TaxID=1866326 RepID=A0AAE9ZJH2_9PROT|nr:hypothetical protein [Hyphococcus flavus]WDI31680.1 hypothetical protein PUV54_00570 [Hyphococcus flavus]
MNKVALALTAILFVSGCATVGPAAYGPADSDGFGYEETRIESDRYRIVYRGSGGMSPELVEDYALLRAAELALANGYDWFRIVGRDVAGEQRGGVGVGAGFGSGSYGRRGGVGVGVGGNLGTIGGRDYFTVRMEVLMGEGAPPEDGQYYDARGIADTIGARISG